jgi:protein SCO1
MTIKRSSTTITILVLTLLCMAIFASVIIFRLKQPAEPQVISSDHGGLLSEPRVLQPFTLRTAQDMAFTRQSLLNHWTLLFFGFTHCAQICPTTLDLLKRVYPTLEKAYPNLQVVFISLDPERDSPDLAAAYAKKFASNFIGATSDNKTLRLLQSQLGIFSAKQNSENSAGNYQIQHTSLILLMDPKAQWVGFFRYGLTPQQFEQSFFAAMNALKA